MLYSTTGITCHMGFKMKKKLMIFCILSVFMLVTITFASAVNVRTLNTADKRISPLFGIRTKKATGIIFEKIKTRFIRSRIFYPPIIFNKIFGNTETEQWSYHPYCYTITDVPDGCDK